MNGAWVVQPLKQYAAHSTLLHPCLQCTSLWHPPFIKMGIAKLIEKNIYIIHIIIIIRRLVTLADSCVDNLYYSHYCYQIVVLYLNE